MKNMRSIIAGLAFLLPALTFAVPRALAEGTALAEPKHDVGRTSLARQTIQWTQDRLAEADATIAALERQAAKLQGDARAKAEAALKTLRDTRDAYRMQAEVAAADARTWTDAQVEEVRKRLDSAWAAFQAARDSYLDSTKADLAARRAVLDAELEARRTVWQKSIEDLRVRADKVAADQKVAIQERISALKAQVDNAQARLANASSETWKALQKSYSDVRLIFIETYGSIRRSVDDASK